ncbi:MAG: hypothetical protein ACP6IY_09045 [Promethearchaeia archaeon]
MSKQSENIIKKDVETKQKLKKSFEKIKNFEDKTDFSIYLGAGLYEIAIGLLLLFLFKFLIGLYIIMAYPYITPELLYFLKIFGILLTIFGILSIITPIIHFKLNRDLKALNIFVKINSIIIIFLIPMGPFVAIGLWNKSKKQTLGREKEFPKIYFFIMFIAGLLHIGIGLLMLLIINPTLTSSIKLLYPMINYQLINFLTILAWISLLSGSSIFIISFFSKSLYQIENIRSENLIKKFLVYSLFISSLFLVLVFPIGTFFGLILLQDSYVKIKK